MATSYSNNQASKCYPSNAMDQFIVNAVSGTKYPFRVGSRKSLTLFKVIDTSGAYDKTGKMNMTSDIRRSVPKEPNHFYFDGPQEYAQHRGFHHDHKTSETWDKYKNTILKPGGDVDISKYNSLKNGGHNNNFNFIMKEIYTVCQTQVQSQYISHM